MSGFTKLFSSIVDSTIWREDPHTKVVWVTMLAKADRNGTVSMSLPGLADASRVSIEQCRAALAIFLAPDEWSRTKDFDGRRIMETDGGWILLNYQKYRKIQDEDQKRIATADRVRRHREKLAGKDPVTQPVTNVTPVTPGNAIADAEAEAEAEENQKTLPAPAAPEPTKKPSKMQEVVEIWNATTAGKLPKAKPTAKREGLLRACLKEPGWLEDFRTACAYLATAPFYHGTNDRGWQATLDYALRPGKATELAEKYTAPKPPTTGAHNGKPHHRTETDSSYIAQLAERDARRATEGPGLDPGAEDAYLAELDGMFAAPRPAPGPVE